MNNNISPMNNVSFQAKLDISKVKGSKQRWQNIARLFEEKTKRYSKDVVELEGSFKNGFELSFMEKDTMCDFVLIKDNAAEKMKKLSDKDIVKNIISIMKHTKKQTEIYNQKQKLAKSMNLTKLNDNNLMAEFEAFMGKVEKASNRKFVENNPIFENKGIHFFETI